VPLVLAPRAERPRQTSHAGSAGPGERAANLAAAKVSIVACRDTGPRCARRSSSPSTCSAGLAGSSAGKTVTVKVNLTGRPFQEVDGRAPTETYITHDATAIALAGTLLDGGARRVRFVESAPFAQPLEAVLGMAGWDVKALLALKGVEVENTRNLGLGTRYATMKVPRRAHVLVVRAEPRLRGDRRLRLPREAEEPRSRGRHAVDEEPVWHHAELAVRRLEALGRRDRRSHAAARSLAIAVQELPGQREGDVSPRPGHRVPRIIVDLCAARPVHLAILDGITSVAGAEGPWVDGLRPVSPGVLVCGLNPVSTDAVATAVMGYPDPRAAFGTLPFVSGDNHVALADQMGLGTADLGKIDLRGMKIAEAVHPFGAVGRTRPAPAAPRAEGAELNLAVNQPTRLR